MLFLFPLALRPWDGLCPGVGPVWTSFWSEPTSPPHLVPSLLSSAHPPLPDTLSSLGFPCIPRHVFPAHRMGVPTGPSSSTLSSLPGSQVPGPETEPSHPGRLFRMFPWGPAICLFKDSAVQPGGGPFDLERVSQP